MAQKGAFSDMVFDGSKDPKEFIRLFKITALMNEWDAAKQLEVIELFLKDKALRYYNALTVKTNISHVFTELIAKCTPSNETFLTSFYNRKLNPQESITVFATDIQNLLFKALPTLSAAEQSTMLRKRLCDECPPQLRATIHFSAEKSWDDMLACLEKAMPYIDPIVDYTGHGMKGAGGTRFEASAYHPLAPLPLIKQEPVDMNWTDSRRPSGPGSSKFKGACFYCNTYGHRKIDCRSRIHDESNTHNRFKAGHNNRTEFSQGNNNNARYPPPPTRNISSNYNRNAYSNSGPGSQQGYNHGRTSQAQSNSISGRGYETDQNWRSPPPPNHTSNATAQSTHAATQDDDDESFPFFSFGHTNSIEVLEEKLTKISTEFPFFVDEPYMSAMTPPSESSSNVIEVRSALTKGSTFLLKVDATLTLFNDETLNVRALIDGGSTHSFISPLILSDFQRNETNSSDHMTKEKRNFIITSATDRVPSECCVTLAHVGLGPWSGTHQFTISNDVVRNDMVLGRDFLRANRVLVDHGNDTLEFAGLTIKITEISTSVIGQSTASPPLDSYLLRVTFDSTVGLFD